MLAFAFVVAITPLRAASGSSSQVQSILGENVKATFSLPVETLPRFGFVPVRVAIENRQQRDLRWNVVVTVTSHSNMHGTSVGETSVTLLAPAGRNSDHWIFLATPDPGMDGSRLGYVGRWGSLQVRVRGTAIEDRTLFFNPGVAANHMVPWAVSTSVENAVRSHLTSLKEPPHTPGGPRPPVYRGRPPTTAGPRPLLQRAPQLFVFDPAQPLGDWRSWSPFARVVLRAEEYATLSPATRASLRSWVALGGSLYLVPEGTAPGATQTFGAGQIISLERPISGEGAHDSNGLFHFDSIFRPTLAMPPDLTLQKSGLSQKVAPARHAGDWLVYFFVGFAVLVGPVNLFAIAPIRRRQWLFISVPAISSVAVVLLLSAIYLQDGVGGEGVRRSLVVLLPGDNQAAVFQEQVTRTGLLFGTSFPIADDTICAAVPADETGQQLGRALEYTRQDGRASGDWFRGRARQAQHLRRLTPTRARVELVGTAPDGAPIVQSSVGTALRKFYYRDPADVVWSAAVVSPGARVTLTREKVPERAARTAGAFGLAASGHFAEIVRRSTEGSAQGAFLAFADDFDLAPLSSLASIDWMETRVLVTGRVESAAAAAGKATP